MILVTGPTGNVGSELVRLLSQRGVRARAFVHNLSSAQSVALPGIEAAPGDFAKPDTIARALEGVDRLVLLIPSSAEVEQQQIAFVDAAKQAGVRHIVYLSQFGAHARTAGRFQRYHGAVEDHIRNSGIAFTFLRPNLFMQALLNFRGSIANHGSFYLAAGIARVSIVDVRDIAAVAAAALADSGHEGKIYEITGPEALSHSEMANMLSAAVGKPVKFVDITPESMRRTLLGLGMPAWQAEGVIEDFSQYRRGDAARITSTIQDVTGQPPIPFAQFAHDYAGYFQAQSVGAA